MTVELSASVQETFTAKGALEEAARHLDFETAAISVTRLCY